MSEPVLLPRYTALLGSAMAAFRNDLKERAGIDGKTEELALAALQTVSGLVTQHCCEIFAVVIHATTDDGGHEKALKDLIKIHGDCLLEIVPDLVSNLEKTGRMYPPTAEIL